jgi:hypothetical protein
VPKTTRDKSPQRVLYSTESLGNPKAYWTRVDGREDENLPGTIDARIEGQTINIKTKNVDAYTLNLALAPSDSNTPVEIVENGQNLGHITARTFQKRADKYVDAAQIKNEQLHGPVWDIFTEPFVVVRPTGNEFS